MVHSLTVIAASWYSSIYQLPLDNQHQNLLCINTPVGIELSTSMCVSVLISCYAVIWLHSYSLPHTPVGIKFSTGNVHFCPECGSPLCTSSRLRDVALDAQVVRSNAGEHFRACMEGVQQSEQPLWSSTQSCCAACAEDCVHCLAVLHAQPVVFADAQLTVHLCMTQHTTRQKHLE